ncbi:MAG TPA: glycyl-radical enzyme activating protein [Candidatus Bathyarchaeia archaeon]|nr:glycyl-radical enzyme activating protein [Candidatus Bathyarchaeia archaeon]
MKSGVVFNVERYAIQDGPGIRTTVFFKGCPLRCWWCHNPEGQKKGFELVFRPSRCIECGKCLKSCTRQALAYVSKQLVIDRKRCTVCGACVCKCPSEALSIAGKRTSVEEVMKIIEKDMPFYDESRGGVTFSGGEPLMQPDFLEALLEECVKKGINTALDTSGYASSHVVDRFCRKIDLFLFDVKIMGDLRHRKYTGVSNRRILENLQRMVKNGGRVEVSLPIIPGINDDEENIEKTGEFLASLRKIESVSLLPYHRMGVDKYKSLGKPYKLAETQILSAEKMKMIKGELEAFGLKVRVEVR